jgi:hypothetical protein
MCVGTETDGHRSLQLLFSEQYDNLTRITIVLKYSHSLTLLLQYSCTVIPSHYCYSTAVHNPCTLAVKLPTIFPTYK